jgi:hypothetical protein
MDFSIKREVYQKVSVQLRQEQLDFMDKFKALIEDSNPEVEAISESEIYQKAFDFLMSDKRVIQKINGMKKKRGTIGDLTSLKG